MQNSAEKSRAIVSPSIKSINQFFFEVAMYTINQPRMRIQGSKKNATSVQPDYIVRLLTTEGISLKEVYRVVSTANVTIRE
jgi:hypothetical protein